MKILIIGGLVVMNYRQVPLDGLDLLIIVAIFGLYSIFQGSGPLSGWTLLSCSVLISTIFSSI